MEVAHRGYVSLRRRCEDGLLCLAHAVTGEDQVCPVLPLPSASVFEEWSLHFTEDGWGYIVLGSTRVWASEILKVTLHEAPGGAFFVKRSDGLSVWLPDYLTQRTAWAMSVVASMPTFDMHAWIFVACWGGSYVWAILLDLHGGSMLRNKVSAASWVTKGWDSWRRACSG